MNERISRSILGLALALCPLAAGAQDLLIKNATVLTVTRGALPKGDILILGGIIREIGEGLAAPKGVRVVDAAGRFAVPGLFDSHTHIALTDINEMGDAVTPEVSVADALNAEDIRIFDCLTGGVTTVHTMHGSGNPIGGRNVTLKLKWGRTAEDLVVPEALPTIKFAQGENIKQSYYNPPTPRYPKSRMGVAAIVRREMLKARAYMEEWDRFNAAQRGGEIAGRRLPPRKDLRLEALADILRGKTLVRCHTYKADETLEMISLSRELGFRIACLDHASEAYKIAGELAAAGIGISVFTDSWSYKLRDGRGHRPQRGGLREEGRPRLPQLGRRTPDAIHVQRGGQDDEVRRPVGRRGPEAHHHQSCPPARGGQDLGQPGGRQARRRRHFQPASAGLLHALRDDDHPGAGLFRPRSGLPRSAGEGEQGAREGEGRETGPPRSPPRPRRSRVPGSP